jgi:hypothetical protein
VGCSSLHVAGCGSCFNDFKQGFEDGQKSSTYDTQADSHGFRAEIRVTPISTPSDSLNLQLPGKTVKAPYQVSEVTCLIKETPTMLITIIFSALGVIVLSVYGVYCLIRVLICITRQDIFSRRNIRWLRWIAYGQLAVTSLSFLLDWSIEQAVLAQAITFRARTYTLLYKVKSYEILPSLFIRL